MSTEPENLNTLKALTYLNEMDVPPMLHRTPQTFAGLFETLGWGVFRFLFFLTCISGHNLE